MNRRARDAMADMWAAHGELLPLSATDGTELFVHNTRTVDALDMRESEVVTFPNGRIMYVKRPVFIEALLANVDIFRLPFGGSEIYVSERFVTRVHEHPLTGLTFKSVAPGA